MLTQSEIANAKTFITTIFYAAGVSSKSAGRNWWWPTKESELICDEILNRGFTFYTKNLDDALKRMAQQGLRTAKGGTLHKTADQFAEYIAWFCSQAGIIWDDSLATPQEMQQYRSTIFGKALSQYKCFLSDISAAAATPAPTQSQSATKQSSTKQPGQAPINGYKSSGPHSADIPNLIGSANNKIHPTAQYLYCIEADMIGKNVPNAYITPLKTTNTSIVKVSKTDAEKVKFGSGNGYTDCTLWFDSQADADNCKTACINAFGSKYSNIHVAKARPDSNGYYQVSTEFGDAYIKAKKLNEELDEVLESLQEDCVDAACEKQEEEPIYENASKNFNITNVQLYSEWMHKSNS